MGEVNAHPDFFLCLNFLDVTRIGAHQSVGSVTGAMMFCSCNRSSSAFKVIAEGKGDSTGRPNAKGFGVIHQGNVEVLTLHRLDHAIKHHRVFVSNISWGQYSYGCDLGWVLWADGFGVVSGQDVKALGDLPRKEHS